VCGAISTLGKARRIQSLTELAQPLQLEGMPLKPNGRMCKVREQIIEDSASGLTLQFECDDGRLRLVIAGAPLKLGNREIFFDEEGREAGAGTLVGELRRPSWLRPV
jgi:hypothetical protein